jgi:hypothetical protein
MRRSHYHFLWTSVHVQELARDADFIIGTGLAPKARLNPHQDLFDSPFTTCPICQDMHCSPTLALGLALGVFEYLT